MSDKLHYNSQRDKDMDERLAHPIEEKIVCKNCQAEYWECESHECKPIAEIDSGLDRISKKMDEGDIYLDALSEVIGNLNMRIKVLEKENAQLKHLSDPEAKQFNFMTALELMKSGVVCISLYYGFRYRIRSSDQITYTQRWDTEKKMWIPYKFDVSEIEGLWKVANAD